MLLSKRISIDLYKSSFFPIPHLKYNIYEIIYFLLFIQVDKKFIYYWIKNLYNLIEHITRQSISPV